MKKKVEFSKTQFNIDARIIKESKRLDADLGTIQLVTELIGGKPYAGEYSITPKVEEQTMFTKDKVMLDDVTIRPIPFFEVSNQAGGNTIYIAGEIEME